MLGRTTQWFHHRHPTQWIPADVEDQAVPVCGHDVGGPFGQAPTPKVGPCGGRRLGLCRVDVGLVDDRLQADAVSQALAGAEIVVLQIERLQPGIGDLQTVPLGVALDQSLLGDPIDNIGNRSTIGTRAPHR